MTQPDGVLTYSRTSALVDRYLEDLKHRFGEHLLAVVLFGSVARNEGGPTSDLDLIIVHTLDRSRAAEHVVDSSLALRRTSEYSSLASEGFLPDPMPILLTLAALATHPWILLDVLDHGIVLLDRGEILQSELARMRRRLEVYGARKVPLADGSWYWDLKPDWKPGDIVEL